MNNYLNAINNAAITNVKRVHGEDEDNGLEDHLASILEHETHKN